MADQWGGKSKGKAVWGKKLLGGYAGVKFTADKIKQQMPNMTNYGIYVEPFAGLGRTAEDITVPIMILNDRGEYSNQYCREKFPNATVENMDFKDTIIKYDSENTFFLIDPPWRFECYDKNDKAFCDRKVYDYYKQILDLVDNIKGDWFILSSADEHEQKNILVKSKWGTKIVVSDGNPIFGKKARTMICSNLFDPTVKETLVYPLKTEKIRSHREVKKEDPLLCDICGYLARDEIGFTEHINRPFHQNRVE